MRVEAASWLGKPVFFKLVGPWTKPSSEHMPTRSERTRSIFLLVLGITLLIVPAWLAWRNIARGKADQRGALRLGVGAVLRPSCCYGCSRDTSPHRGPMFGQLAMALAASLFDAAVIWMVYLALEPYVRRHWPHSIISWSRLIDGQFRDPAVGRDVLFGVVLGTIWTMIGDTGDALARGVGAEPSFHDVAYLNGMRSTLAAWTAHMPEAIRITLVFFFMLFILRALLRNKWLAAAVFVAIWTALQGLQSSHPLIAVPVLVAIYFIAAVALVRFGLVTLAVAAFTTDSIGNMPITMNPSVWYFGSTAIVVASIVVLAAWAFRTATAGRKLFAADLFE